MDLALLEQHLRREARVIVADPRVVRRVIKHHRKVVGLVPHERCYALPREALLDIVAAGELGLLSADVPPHVILLARPTSRDMRDRTNAEVITRVWRTVFHARVHVVLEARLRDGVLDDAALRKRIETIGPTEFDEVRDMLRHDALVLPPYSDRDVFIEFAAVYLELRHFAPALLVTMFPGLSDYERVDAVLGADLDVPALLTEGCPPGVVLAVSPVQGKTMVGGAGVPSVRGVASAPPSAVGVREHQRLMRRADAAHACGNDVRAMLAAARAGLVDDSAGRLLAMRTCHAAETRLAGRLQAALPPSLDDPEPDRATDWSLVLHLLVERAVSDGNSSRFGIEARLLYQLQRAAAAHEQPHRGVDVATWLLSLGRRPVVRTLEDRELRVARAMRATLARGHHVRLAPVDRRTVSAALQWGADRAERNARNALRPRLNQVFDDVSLRAQTATEHLARHKLVEELLDHILEQGFLSFGQVRDAISRNAMKLYDLTGVRELWRGDPLLRADARLAVALDGVYHRSDIYLRALQRLSSLPFGTRVGRVLALYLLLPLGASFVVLEGVGHLLNPGLGLLHLPAVEVLTTTSFLITAGIAFGLLHSEPFRALAKQALEVVGVVLAWVFFRIPRALLARPAVVLLLALPGVRIILRRFVIPFLVAAGVFYLTPLVTLDQVLALAISMGVFAVTSTLMGTRLGMWFEDYVVEQLVPTWQVLSRHWIPGLLRMVGAVFGTLMELLQRGIHRIDELVRFHQGERGVLLAGKAVVGLVWAMIAYAVRLYVTLLVEPELNPLKHFPVVTVAHKLLLPLTPQLLAAVEPPLSPLGPIVGGAITGVTVFLLPSVFGFLAWELKENYKLYRATRGELLGTARIGAHGETMRGLLVAGLHSGTLPKLYERLRRAAQREHERAERRARQGTASPAAPSEAGLAAFRAGIQQVEERMRRFVEREFLAYLHNAPRWTFGTLRVLRIDLSSNRVRVQIDCPSAGEVPCELTIENQAGLLVAGISQPGFLFPLQREGRDGTLLFENALAGFYHRAEVDLVREQLEVELGEGAHYEVSDDGLLVWPGRDYHTELLYAIDARRPGTLAPKMRGKEPDEPPRVLDTRRVLYRHQTITWLAWVNAWVMAAHPRAEMPRLVAGASILPLLEGDARASFASSTPSLALLAARPTPASTPDGGAVPAR